MSSLEQVAHGFYRAFQARDGAAMASHYAADARFSDPVFPALVGPEVGAMWRMLCGRSRDLRIEYRVEFADESQSVVRVVWDADYTFVQTGNPVENHVRATLRVRDGKIASHQDDFSFWKWSRQALGAPGWLLGWTPLLRAKVRGKAAASLRQFMDQRS